MQIAQLDKENSIEPLKLCLVGKHEVDPEVTIEPLALIS